MPSAARTIAPLVAGLLLTAGLLAGCGDDGKSPRSGPSNTTSAAATPTGATPAAGLLIEQPTFSFHLPESWVENDRHTVGNVTLVGGGPVEGWDFNDLMVETWSKRNFDDATKPSGDVLANFKVTAKKRNTFETTEWAGQPAYHLTGTGSLAGHAEQFGVIWKGQHIAVIFDFVSPQSAAGHRPEYELTPAQRQAVIDSVEASWQWK